MTVCVLDEIVTQKWNEILVLNAYCSCGVEMESLVEVSKDLATSATTTSLVMRHDTIRCGKNNATELTGG